MADKRLIDANALEKDFTDWYDRAYPHDKELIEIAILSVEDAPTIEAEPVKHGRWMNRNGHPVSTALSCYSAKCSECELYSGMQYINKPYNYCPYCGTRMDLKEI